jgi:catechol 2,3-dioxygenase-like lactoylglutathione lyase family enzyme
MKAVKVIPVIRMFDYAKMKEFYIDWLGFKIAWEHQFEPNTPYYMEVCLDTIVLHISEHHGDASPGAKVFIWCTELQAYHKGLIDKKYKYNRPGLEKAFWDETGNTISMQVDDPFGNKLLFCETLKMETKAE